MWAFLKALLARHGWPGVAIAVLAAIMAWMAWEWHSVHVLLARIETRIETDTTRIETRIEADFAQIESKIDLAAEVRGRIREQLSALTLRIDNLILHSRDTKPVERPAGGD